MNLVDFIAHTTCADVSLSEKLREEVLEYNKELLGGRLAGNRRVLLIGGSGYIGAVMTSELLKCGYTVRNFDNHTYGQDVIPNCFVHEPRYEYVSGSICNTESFRDALEGVNDVVLLAGLVGDPITKKYPDESLQINGTGVRTIIDALDGHGLENVIFVSTCSNYGLMADGKLADEESDLNPLSTYAEEKVAGEKHLLSKNGSVDYSATVLRFATAFGLSPRMRFDLTVNQFSRELFRGDELLVFDAETWRPYCHTMDFTRLVRRVLETPNHRTGFEVFNAGDDNNNATKQMIVDKVLEVVGERKVEYQEHGSDPRNYRVNFGKVREKLEFHAKYRILDGVREIVDSHERGFFSMEPASDSLFGNYSLQRGF